MIIEYDSDESLIVLDERGKELASANHDDHGWAGMTMLRDAVREIAAAHNIPLQEHGEANV